MPHFVTPSDGTEIYDVTGARARTAATPGLMRAAARVQNFADGDEICMTEEVHGAPEVAEIIAPYPVAKSEAALKGVTKAMSVYHLGRMAS